MTPTGEHGIYGSASSESNYNSTISLQRQWNFDLIQSKIRMHQETKYSGGIPKRTRQEIRQSKDSIATIKNHSVSSRESGTFTSAMSKEFVLQPKANSKNFEVLDIPKLTPSLAKPVVAVR